MWQAGAPNLIAADGKQLNGSISVHRTWGLLTDLNQGVLPYQPFLLPIALLGTMLGLKRNRWETVAIASALLGMMLLAQKATNWNSGCLGLMRYLLWMLPLFIWLAGDAFAKWPKLGRRYLVVFAIAHVGILYFAWPDRFDYVQSNALARWVWRHAPWLDNPDPQVFHSRIAHRDMLFEPALAPVAFIARRRNVTKLLVDPRGLQRLWERFDVTPEYRAIIEAEAERRSEVFYAHPPTGAVKAKPDANSR
jgi:hypothetical protein